MTSRTSWDIARRVWDIVPIKRRVVAVPLLASSLEH